MLLALATPLVIIAGENGSSTHITVSGVFFSLVVLLLAAKIGGELFERLGQPSVLGELLFGIILGNLTLFGYTGLEAIKTHPGIAFAAEVGVILLLFEVGLESNLNGLLDVGKSAVFVAILGITAPMLLGYWVSSIFLPASTWYVHLFVGATLTATSVGITARVLKDLGRMSARESRIILGAAVLDDVLGLIVLAVVTGIAGSVTSVGAVPAVTVQPILLIFSKAIAFLFVAVLLGRYLAGKVLHFGTRFRIRGVPVVLTLCYCFVVSGLSEVVGLAPIVGAFAAGLVLDKTYYQGYRKPGRYLNSVKLEDILSPISSVLIPVFFVLIGLRVNLESLFSIPVLQFASFLCIAAILGKQICSLGVLDKGVNRIVVGIGMIPRGEVGLIFAGIGVATLSAGKPIFDSETFSAVIVMVMVTTLITPPLLTKFFPAISEES